MSSFNNGDNVVFYKDGKKSIGVVKKVKTRSKFCIVKTPKHELKINFDDMFHLDLDKTLNRM